jgi:hypothetical protein
MHCLDPLSNINNFRYPQKIIGQKECTKEGLTATPEVRVSHEGKMRSSKAKRSDTSKRQDDVIFVACGRNSSDSESTLH